MFQREVKDPSVSLGNLKSETLPVPGDRLRGVGKKLLIKFAFGFDLALPSDFFGDYAAWHWHSLLCSSPAFFGEFSAPVPPEGDRARAAQSPGDKPHMASLSKLSGIHTTCTGTSCQLQGTDTKSLAFSTF